MTSFLIIWFGQVVSRLGSGFTGFALGVWVYRRTGSVTQLALISFFTLAPAVLMSPFAGALVDRWDRRRAMLLSDSGAGASSLALALLFFGGRLETWHICLVVAVSSLFQSLQWPAFSAATTLLVGKQNLGRANGLNQMGQAAAQIAAPVLAGALVGRIGVPGIILVDAATFLFAVATLLAVRIPRPEVSAEGAAGRGSLVSEAAYGWTYLTRRPGLLTLLGLFATVNFSVGMLTVLITPLVLSFASAGTLGTVLSIASSGLLVGGLAMAAWGGPARRMHVIFAALLMQALVLFLGGARASAPLITAAAFLYLLGFPIINACSQAIWQTKVAPDVQGRVFAMRQMIALSCMPLAQLAAGPLADFVFKPLLAAGGPLAGSLGRIMGVGPGRGIGLLLMALGIANLLVLAAAWSYPRLRGVEDEVPDAIEEAPAPAPRPAAELS
jgi:DHA3 family macrolide efflux protein-like MFS transporter